MSLDTGIFMCVGLHDTTETAPPELPAVGALLDLSAEPEGWAKVAFEFAEDAFKFAQGDRKRLEVWAPALPMKTKVIQKPPAVSAFDFVSYEVGDKLYQYCTNMTAVNGVYTPLNDHTSFKALIIEVGEVGAIYFPKVTLEAELPAGGVWSLSTQNGHVEVYGTSTNQAGFQWHQYHA
jgi:hypothetical protein